MSTTDSAPWARHWFGVPHALFTPALPLDPTARLVYIYLLHWRGDQGQAFPGYTRMAADLGCSRSSAIRACRALVAAGLLQKVARPGTTNRYQLFHPVAAPPAPDPASDAVAPVPAPPAPEPASVATGPVSAAPAPDPAAAPDAAALGLSPGLVSRTRGAGPVDPGGCLPRVRETWGAGLRDPGAGLVDPGAGLPATRLRSPDPDPLINTYRSRGTPPAVAHPVPRGRPPQGRRPVSAAAWTTLRCAAGHEWASWDPVAPASCPLCARPLQAVR